ncbi:hypothetical protein MUCCIDRAFT_106870 [Mucor lusitanicus CBS 277.49]|uniref:Uncharacterized protein n=1 Tax=Mucor lusitanicus CBS 277.49 TaxID=747725 RepID=A0A162RIK3_MUCCL|nr:hypothetical protein MUCCIDRAFT_106870 [Mucor lusitanicus CBS 277.49]
MEEESNLSVREAVSRLERSLSAERSSSSQSTTGDFSIPGYLRTTASSNSKLNAKRKDDESRVKQQQHQKRRRFQYTNNVVPTKTYDEHSLERQESRESSVFSIASSVRENRDNEDVDQEHFERVILYAKYLQWVFLNNKAQIAFEHKKQAIERELSIAMEAVKEKRRREAALFKEKNDMLDDRDVRKYVQQAQKVADRIQEKIAAKNYDWVEEKKELAVILGKMNDLTANTHEFSASKHQGADQNARATSNHHRLPRNSPQVIVPLHRESHHHDAHVFHHYLQANWINSQHCPQPFR